jgi:hypothetical protein
MDERARDLKYLAQLTLERIKPLSRLEWDIGEEQVRALTDRGLHVQRVCREALNGNKITHVVFSRDTGTLQEYVGCFDNKSLLKTPDAIRQEGRFFGYPECCVESFIVTEGGQPPNKLAPEDQAILYHWACPDCQETPKLVPSYRRVWRQINS